MVLCGMYLQKGKDYPITGLDRPLGIQEVDAPRISKQLAQKGGKVDSPMDWPTLPPPPPEGSPGTQRLS